MKTTYVTNFYFEIFEIFHEFIFWTKVKTNISAQHLAYKRKNKDLNVSGWFYVNEITRSWRPCSIKGTVLGNCTSFIIRD